MTTSQLVGWAVGFGGTIAAAVVLLVYRAIACLGVLNRWLRLHVEREEAEQRLARNRRCRPDHLDRIRAQQPEVDQLAADIEAERERLAGPR